MRVCHEGFQKEFIDAKRNMYAKFTFKAIEIFHYLVSGRGKAPV